MKEGEQRTGEGRFLRVRPGGGRGPPAALAAFTCPARGLGARRSPSPALRGLVPPLSGFSAGSPGGSQPPLPPSPGEVWISGAPGAGAGGAAVAWVGPRVRNLPVSAPLPGSFPPAAAFPPVPSPVLSPSHLASGANSPWSRAFSSRPLLAPGSSAYGRVSIWAQPRVLRYLLAERPCGGRGPGVCKGECVCAGSHHPAHLEPYLIQTGGGALKPS